MSCLHSFFYLRVFLMGWGFFRLGDYYDTVSEGGLTISHSMATKYVFNSFLGFLDGY